MKTATLKPELKGIHQKPLYPFEKVEKNTVTTANTEEKSKQTVIPTENNSEQTPMQCIEQPNEMDTNPALGIEEINETAEETAEAEKPQENEEIQSEEPANTENNVLQEFTEKIDDVNDWSECTSKINTLNIKSDIACLKIGSILYAINEACKKIKKQTLNEFLNSKDLKINKSQAYKYMDSYKLCRDKKNIFHEAGKIKDVGIEKLYLLSKSKNELPIKELVDLTIQSQLSIRELKYTIKLIEKNKSISLEEASINIRSAINDKKLNEKLKEWKIITPKSNDSETKLKTLQDKCNKLERENNELKIKLEQYKSSQVSLAS